MYEKPQDMSEQLQEADSILKNVVDVYQKSNKKSKDTKDLDLVVDFDFAGNLVTRSNKTYEMMEILNLVSELRVKGQSVLAEDVGVAELVGKNAKLKYLFVQKKSRRPVKCRSKDCRIKYSGGTEDTDVRHIYVRDCLLYTSDAADE